MEVVKKRSLSFMTALMLVLSLFALAPEGAFKASAVSGKGTEDNPYVISTYDELREYFSLAGYHTKERVFLKLGKDIVSNDSKDNYQIDTNSYVEGIYLDLAGHKLKRTARTADNNMFILSNKVVINDSVGGGSIESALYTNKATDKCMFSTSMKGKLIIKAGKFIAPYNERSMRSDTIINNRSGIVEIRGGEFESTSTMFKQSTATDNNTTVSGGKFTHIGNDSNAVFSMLGSFTLYNGTFVFETNDLEGEAAVRTGVEGDSIHLSTTVYVNGKYSPQNKSVIYGKDITGNKAEVLYKSPTVERFNITVTEPVEGNSPEEPVIHNPNVELFQWSFSDIKSSEKLGPTDKFVDGREYVFEFSFRPKNGYIFPFAPEVTVNGTGKPNARLVTGQIYATSCLYTAESKLKKVDSFYIHINVPKGGEAPDIDPEIRSEGIEVSSVNWFKGTAADIENLMNRGSKFVAGEKYTLFYTVKPLNGYKFSPTVGAKLNAYTRTVNVDEDSGIVNLKYTFTAKEGDVLKGDVDGNGVINMKDLTTLQRYVNGWDVTINEANSDLDNSCGINMKDVAALQRLINTL